MQDDPVMKEFQDAMKTEGMAAFTRFYNDPEFLRKLGQKVGDMSGKAWRAAEANVTGKEQKEEADPAPVPKKVARSIHEAAKQGDLEAVQKFIANGTDINERGDKG